MTTRSERTRRDYRAVADRVRPLTEGRDRLAVMQHVCDMLWEAFGSEQDDACYSWLGFYFKVANEDEMVLGPRRDKPACSPIGLHGVCGRGWRESRAIIVDDISSLGEEYIACDPRDRSEVLVPMFDDTGACYGVFDGDSYGVATFDEQDVEGMAELLESLSLSVKPAEPKSTLRL